MEIKPGTLLLVDGNLVRVVQLDHRGVTVSNPVGESHSRVTWTALMASSVPILPPGPNETSIALPHHSWREHWANVPGRARKEALDRLGHVLEVETGFRLGFAALALADEPKPEYDVMATSHRKRVASKAEEVTVERKSAESPESRQARGLSESRPPVSEVTVYRWVKAYRERGLMGLVDARLMKRRNRPGVRFGEFADELESTISQAGPQASKKSVAFYLRQTEGHLAIKADDTPECGD